MFDNGRKQISVTTLRILSIFFLFSLTFIIFCDRQLKQLVAPDENDFPDAPKNLIVMVDDGKIFLSWKIDNVADVKSYHIYRKDSVNAKMSLLDSCFTSQYIDSNVRNGKLYYYQISAVNKAGYEGERSAQVSARPNVFSVLIENGDEYTSKRNVSLNLTAPFGTKYMLIGNDSLYSNSSWEPYASTKNWMLTGGDGKKYVYVKFRDSDENETQLPIFDTIILDTKAVISAVTQNTNGQIKVPGQIIHFTVVTGEIDGNASIDIGEEVKDVKLYDDGTNGDAQPDDGTYEIDYKIPLGLQVVNAIITGHFADRANNIAKEETAEGTVTIQQDPLAVTLYPPAPTGTENNVLELYWSKSPDTDFASYRLYRKTSPGVDTSSVSNLVATITNKEITNYTDENVKNNTDYYYRVFVFDKFGRAKGSNEVVGRVETKPSPVILLPPAAKENSLTSLILTWSKNEDDDFESYRIYRAKAPKEVDSTSFVVDIIYDQNTTNYEDTVLKEDTEYNYQIYVFDTGGNSSGSNKAKGKTNANEPPSPVTLLTPTPVGNSTTSLNLNWSKSADEDFSSYRIYRTKVPQGVDSSSFVVDIIYDQNITSYQDTNLNENTEYNYRIYVFDTGGKSSGSNTVTGKTNSNEPPTPVNLLTPSPIGDSYTSLYLSWTKNLDEDFASYRVYRNEASQKVDSTSFLVGIIYDQNTTNYEDKNLKEETEYSYRVYVFDSGGKSTGSNTATGKTNMNEPPKPVILAQPVVIDSTTLQLSWSQNDDLDFDYYTIYRSESSPVDTLSTPIAIINDRNTIQYYDANLVTSTTYYYRILVTDTGGLSSGSNEASGTPKP